jgi:hypothetical protein
MAGNEAKTLPTTKRPLVCNRSLAFNQPMFSPELKAFSRLNSRPANQVS